MDDNGDVQTDHDQIQAWVNDMADEYNSDKVSMQFTTTSGSEISLKVPVGGEAIDTSALFKDVVKYLEDKVSGDSSSYRESFRHQPKFRRQLCGSQSD